MRDYKWAIAVAFTSLRYGTWARSFTCAFAWLPHVVRATPSMFQRQGGKQQLQCRNHNLPKTLAIVSMAQECADRGRDGESWCNHNLLNTVTTAWVEDNLHDPEVRLYRVLLHGIHLDRHQYFPTKHCTLN